MAHYLLGLLQQQGAPANPAQGQAGGSNFIVQFLPLILIFAVFYFLVIRPQSRKAKDHQAMLAALKKGDEVVTTGGIVGRISGIKDDEITLQVQEGVRLRVLRSHVQGPHRGGGEAAKPSTTSAEAKASSS